MAAHLIGLSRANVLLNLVPVFAVELQGCKESFVLLSSPSTQTLSIFVFVVDVLQLVLLYFKPWLKHDVFHLVGTPLSEYLFLRG